MKCFKHLCAKLFLCLGFFTGWGFLLSVHAEEIEDTTVAVDAANAAIIADAMISTDTTVVADSTAITDTMMFVDVVAVAEARAQDVDRLSRIIQTEGGTFDDKVCVGLTVLHRVDSPQFPNTVEENINAPSQYANPARGAVMPENLLAAEYAMELWESGISYSVLPSQFLYFAGNGKRNRFHDTQGNHYESPEIAQIFITPYTTEGPFGPFFHFLMTFLVTSNFSMYFPIINLVWA